MGAPYTGTGRIGDSALAARLGRELSGQVLFDSASRGRYSTDASIYQIEPIGVVVPDNEADIARAIQIAADEGIPILPRGGGTSQCGQTVGEALIVDVSKNLAGVISLDKENRRVTVQPGIVLDQLNAYLKPHGLYFPVDVSTSSRATIGGMTANNSCGARSIRYGNMVDNVHAVDAILADGSKLHFGQLPDDFQAAHIPARYRDIATPLLDLGRREAAEITARFPEVQRRVGGYNIDALVPDVGSQNLAHLLVGSEGTLAFSTAIELDLAPIPSNKILGICHFPDFYAAMDATQHIVKLDPTAVELVDRTMIDLAREIEIFRPTIERFVRGAPAALLLVEFAGEDCDEQLTKMARLVELMGDLGFPGAVVEATDPGFQSAVWEVRKSGLNIMMSMKGDGKPISFIEDCAVRLEDLAEYTDRLTKVFHKHGTEGTWYAHASVGCLHVRPVVNLKDPDGAVKMRAMAEEAFEMVREYKGSHSGEHGDGLVRSEFHLPMFGQRMVDNFAEVKQILDPKGLFNPGKIVAPPKMDDRRLFRFKPDYRTEEFETGLDWSAWGGFGRAVEMCNNNGACRNLNLASVMCPSFKVTGDEAHLTRGRANLLRLGLSGQLGQDALHSEAMADALSLCVGCKGCKRECPVGVDMAAMKIEVQYQRTKRNGISLHDRLVAYLPRYAPWAARLAPLLNLRDQVPGLAWLSEKLFGFTARRPLPKWRRDVFAPNQNAFGPVDGPEVVLFADTFNATFETENLTAAIDVLTAAGRRVHIAQDPTNDRRLCCGRTYLSAGLVDQARAEMTRTVEALSPFIARGLPILGLEPSCLLTLRDELLSVLPGAASEALAKNAMLLEEYLAAEHAASRLELDLGTAGEVLLHGHCHQKAHQTMSTMTTTLALLPNVEATTVQSSCCGMAGAFGYGAETYETSQAMAEAALLPAVRAAASRTTLVANGTSCRQQIKHGSGREAVHIVRVLQKALK
ncbi:MAG: FAD-binding protein [Rhodospirillaceae bacterium]|jgi:FAD/FMN-containing dehydrogenase/Fe-S oxidoreductase|nr:FAD-binding protein [Rhodospirillaceae bacterium]MBT5895693.1 FAD-binding protein [Rhodospirillaceae bacterium]MBT6430651.1 FAD-binding protein [Rhodospirillaceae bacterium]MBT7758170.1 FAD-binding protein [Rhodospirillaceae bacterium]